MSGNNLTDGLDCKSEFTELKEIVQDSKELRDEIQCFEYKNRSKNGEYYVFSYNTIIGEKANNIKRKYINQYGGSMEGLLITDVTGKEIDSSEFEGGEKIYLKTKISNHPKPIEFKDITKSGETKKSCTIKFPGWDTTSIKQIYQDEFNQVIENDRFIIMDDKGNVYDDNHKFKVGESVFIIIKEKSDVVQTNANGENKEKQNRENPFKELIERQRGPVTHGNREKSEISLTFDDGYWPESIRTILETLRGSGIKATFFILGECIRDTPDLWKQAIEDGHQICCHTYSHAYLSEGPTTELFKGHGIKPENRPKLIKSWEDNVIRLLGKDYYDKIKSKNPRVPEAMNSAELLETEILMREEEVKQTLGEEYFSSMKLNNPFFRFPGGCGAIRSENIDVLKKHGYLAIGWNGEPKYGIPDKVNNGDIPLFHFDKTNVSKLKPYLSRMKESEKNPKLISEIIVP